ncbi:hypothetical protein JCGZ_00185 [Jatropha curcas]|uniref:Aminotransferase-like plant mobile domain-containing protein n=1 Tax=Jatropha curcas TaxID=180498 RepID=A0A067JTC0_JATCU|nr:hypothetical protein JCGZ_00185 [Jatropha curcas]
MAQLPEIPAFAYTPEMETLGVIPDIPVFEGERVPVSRNALTPGTRPLQLLLLPGSDFPVRHDTDAMRGFQSELRHAGASYMTQLFLREQLRDAAVRSYATLLPLNHLSLPLLHARFVLADPPLMLQTSGTCWTPPMRSRVVAAGFGDYAAGLRRTQPQFPPAMRYSLMERWNDCTHSFIFGFGEMTLTPADYTAITGLGFSVPDCRTGS